MPVSKLDEFLKELVAEASMELPEVTTRRMFGSDAFFANAKIYALIWDGRIALKMYQPERYQELLAMPGASTWTPIPSREQKPMSGWVLVTEELHDDLDRLRPWVESAHLQAMNAPAKKPRAKAKPKAPRKQTKRKR